MNKSLKIILWILGILVSLAVVFLLVSFIGFRMFFMPKFNANIENDSEKLTTSDFIGIAGSVADKQILENIINFDKESAKEALVALNEIGKEDNLITEPETPPKKTDIPADDTQNLQSAYERIMNSAEKNEIDEGLAIIKKLSIAKVTELRKAGDTQGLKDYIKSVLSQAEITVALRLYNKYKHLL